MGKGMGERMGEGVEVSRRSATGAGMEGGREGGVGVRQRWKRSDGVKQHRWERSDRVWKKTDTGGATGVERRVW